MPKGPVGRRFIKVYTLLVDRCIERKWNSEQFLIFPMVILQRVKGTNNSHNIHRRIEHCYDLWDAYEFNQLVEDTVATARWQMLINQHQETETHVTKTFVNMLFQGKLHQVVCWLMGWEKEGLLSPNNRCTKLGGVVFEVL
eukprot:12117915-Ditylum_brightwellii.AAC.2